ncbi:hypothetical protein Clacol_000845 [Clathrus columnatus]|uniref:O-methyltransferase C-terminal domain-containing protein n=1 Tax=Clathrus columnatus TaxID=1419009 RepID=A0AAV5A242_9AGAM|nr:hypothetical protein Clacol_000845 [Clathrus columnatus]
MTLPKLRDLSSLLTHAISQLEETCTKNGTSIPDLDAPFDLSSEAFREDPVAARAASIIGAAASHIGAIVNPPQHSLFEFDTSRAAALRVCLESNVVEILQEAGSRGMHINDIVAQNEQDPSKLGSCLRYMATLHVFREVAPNVFVNNRISSVLDTGKSVQELCTHPGKKHENTPGLAALMGFHLDEGAKALANLWEICSDSTTAKSGEPSRSAFAKFVGHGKTLWEYFDDPEQDFRRRRFNIAMEGIQRLQPSDIMLSVYDWKTVPVGSVIVDVGGGLGTTQLSLARELPHIKIVIQDKPHVVEEGIKIWREKDPDALLSGRVSFEGTGTMSQRPQPQRDVSFFFLKQIMHDWSDEYCSKILTQLRKAASPTTKLLSMDTIIQHACYDQTSLVSDIPGAIPDEAPYPLLPNWGTVNSIGYCADMLSELLETVFIYSPKADGG